MTTTPRDLLAHLVRTLTRPCHCGAVTMPVGVEQLYQDGLHFPRDCGPCEPDGDAVPV